MTEEQQQTEQQKESDQLRQRRENFEELQRLGVTAYPHAFARTRHSRRARRRRMSAKTGEELEAAQIQTTTAGRVLAIRSFGKANFLVISDGAREDPGLRPQGRAQRARLRDLQAARLRRLRRRRGAPVPHQDQRADDLGLVARVPGQVFHPDAREVARPAGRRDPLPPALPGSDRQPGLAARVRGAEPGAERHPRRS